MRYRKRNHKKRIEYLRVLLKVVKDKGSKVYLDESGFKRTSHPSEADMAGVFGRRRDTVNAVKHPSTSTTSAKHGKRILAPSLLTFAMFCLLLKKNSLGFLSQVYCNG